jgi:PIN domain nuclease of toxin-antitoxin system
MTASLLVTDTHPLIWYMTDHLEKLPKKVVKAFDRAVAGEIVIFVPMVALWELSMAVKSGKLRLAITLDKYVKAKFFAKSISILPIEAEDVLSAHGLRFTKDPFDTIIVATALRMDAPLITGDSLIHKELPCQLFWD